MAKIIGLPKLSPTMEEGTLAKWVKQEGDSVDVDDLLAEVETDKATMEFRSFDRGTLLKILVEEGEILEAGTPVAIIGKKGEDVADLVDQARRDGGGNGAAAPAPESRPAEAEQAPAEPRARAAEAGAPGRRPAAESAAQVTPSGRVLASPLVRRLAREHDVDLTRVPGSGPGGRIVKRDLDAHLEAPAAARPTAPGERPPPRIEKASSMRRTIARRLTESKQQVPHYYLNIDLDAEPLLEARREINAQLEASGEKISLNDLLIKGSAVALRRMPEVNVSWIDGEIHYHQRVDISVAVAIPEGLVTPVVRDADRKGVADIAREARELAARARDRKLQPEEMSDGTFSISNMGMFGIEDFAAVINPPEGAILAVGTVRDEPVVQDGQVVPGKRMRLTMSCDHRVIDGAVGARFLALLKQLLESPVTLLL